MLWQCKSNNFLVAPAGKALLAIWRGHQVWQADIVGVASFIKGKFFRTSMHTSSMMMTLAAGTDVITIIFFF